MEKQRCADKDLVEKDDLIQKILVLLPVVSLLRFKSVCKSWCTLIQTSSFIDLYFNSSSSSSKFGSFILHAAVDCERFSENTLLMLSSVSSSECVGGGGGGGSNDNDNDDDQQQQQQLVLKLDNLWFPYTIIEPSMVMVVGSCNGLICLYDELPNEISLWNPATRQCRILPKPPSITIAGDVHSLFAFCFDAETKDYNVVLLSVWKQSMLDYYVIDEPVAMECICRVRVYSLSTNSWRFLQGITCLPGFPFPCPLVSSSELFYLNGCCFFMAMLLYSEQCIPPGPKSRDKFMISLDLTEETITPIQLPYHHHRIDQLYLCYLGMKIALLSKISEHDPTCFWDIFHIWVFNEHISSNVCHESWKRNGSFKIQHGLPGELIIPRCISNDGVFGLLETEIRGALGNKKKKMRLYNLVTGKVKKNFLVLSKPYAYKPSLVSISIVGKTVAAE